MYMGNNMYQYPKPYLSVAQLTQKLEDLGMEIASQEEAEKAFTTIGYYRLKGYCYHKFDSTANQYSAGTKLGDVLRLYSFDTKMSHLIFGYISQIEVALRVRLVNAFQPMLEPTALNDPSFFKNKEHYWKNQGAVSAEIARSSDVFIAHNFDNHDGAIPMWAAVEIMSFGTLSKMIKNLKGGQNSVLSNIIQNYKYKNSNGQLIIPSKNMFTSWIQTVSAMRNICAHNSRIYNRAISSIPQLIHADCISPTPRFNGLYQIILAMKYLRPTDESWNDFVNELKALIFQYSDVCDLNRINFPSDWEAHFTV